MDNKPMGKMLAFFDTFCQKPKTEFVSPLEKESIKHGVPHRSFVRRVMIWASGLHIVRTLTLLRISGLYSKC